MPPRILLGTMGLAVVSIACLAGPPDDDRLDDYQNLYLRYGDRSETWDEDVLQMCVAHRRRDHAGAERIGQQAVSRGCRDPICLTVHAFTAEELQPESWEEVTARWRAAVGAWDRSRYPEGTALRARAEVGFANRLFGMARPDEALPYFERAYARAHPDDAEFFARYLYGYGTSLEEAHQYERSESIFWRGASQGQTLCWGALSRQYFERGLLPLAAAAGTRCLEDLDPASGHDVLLRPAERLRFHVEQESETGYLLHLLGRTPEGIALMERAVGRLEAAYEAGHLPRTPAHPSDAVLRARLSLTYAANGDPEQARQQACRMRSGLSASTHWPDYGWSLLLEARALLNLDRTEEATARYNEFTQGQTARSRIPMPLNQRSSQLAIFCELLSRAGGDATAGYRAVIQQSRGSLVRGMPADADLFEGELAWDADTAVTELGEQALRYFADRGLWADAFEAAELCRSNAFRAVLRQRRGISDGGDCEIARIQGHLAASTALLTYYVSGDDVFAWYVTRGDVTGVRLESTRETIEHSLILLHRAVRSPSSGTEWEEPAAALHRMLLDPVCPATLPAQMYVAPHGMLHFVPFELLGGDPSSRLLARTTTAHLPFPGSLVLLHPPADAPPRRQAPVAIGHAGVRDAPEDLAGSLRRILDGLAGDRGSQGIVREAERVAALLDGCALLCQHEATEPRVRESGADSPTLHFSCHGYLDPIIPDQSALVIEEGGGEDGFLTAREIRRWTLRGHPAVFLSACSSGIEYRSRGDSPLGLVSAFQTAGADSVIATLWPVAIRETADFATEYYTALREYPPHAALRATALRSARAGLHPYFWAGFRCYATEPSAPESTAPAE